MLFSKNYVAFAIIAVVIFTVYMAIVHLVFYTSQLKNRVKNSASPFYLGEEAEEAQPVFALFCEWTLSLLKINPATRKDLAQWLAGAGLTSPYAVTYYLFFSRIAQPFILIAGIAFLLKSFSTGDIFDILTNILITFVFVVIGAGGAKFYVDSLKQQRLDMLLRSFPEMLDLLLVCIESGLGLDAALNRVCKELRDIHPAVISELDRTRLELTMLNDRGQALQNLADRVDLVSFKTLAAALLQTERFGTSLVDTLRVLSEEQRLARLYAVEQKAARIPVLITIPLILCIMPAFIMILVAPPIIKIVNQGGLFGSIAAAETKK